MEQAAENQVTDRGKGTESIPGHRGACIKAVRIPGEVDPRTEHSRDPGCFAGEMGKSGRKLMNGLIYIVGLIVVIMFILSFLGLR